MATQDYYRWVAAGRPFRRPPWLSELKALAHQYGVAFLGDLGNDDHLKADRPQDHTPYSYTEWPVQIAEYVINAIDLARGPWAYRLIDAGKSGRAPWLKYVNVDGRHYNVKNNWVPTTSSDVHGHVSGRTDHTWTGLNGLNPFIEQGSDDMNESENARLQWAAHMQETPSADGKMLEVIEGGKADPANPVAGRPYQLGIQLNRIEHKLDELLADKGTVTARAPLSVAHDPDAEPDDDKAAAGE